MSSINLIDLKAVMPIVGLKRAMIYRLIQADRFPKPHKFGKASRWLKSEAEAWAKQNWRLPA